MGNKLGLGKGGKSIDEMVMGKKTERTSASSPAKSGMDSGSYLIFSTYLAALITNKSN